MATTLSVAVDEIYGAITTAWNSGTPAIIGGSPATPALLLYEDTELKGRPDDDRQTAWARVSVRHATGEQHTLADASSKRLFCNYGVVTVQCFAPMRDNTGALVARRLAEVAKAAFEGVTTENVWFSNVRFQEQGREGTWYQINVSADFQWDEMR